MKTKSAQRTHKTGLSIFGAGILAIAAICVTTNTAVASPPGLDGNAVKMTQNASAGIGVNHWQATDQNITLTDATGNAFIALNYGAKNALNNEKMAASAPIAFTNNGITTTITSDVVGQKHGQVGNATYAASTPNWTAWNSSSPPTYTALAQPGMTEVIYTTATTKNATANTALTWHTTAPTPALAAVIPTNGNQRGFNNTSGDLASAKEGARKV